MRLTRTRRATYALLRFVLDMLTAVLSPAVYGIWAIDWLDAHAQRRLLGVDIHIPTLRDGIHWTLEL